MLTRYQPAGPARIAVIDDHPIVRAGLRALLASQPSWQLCWEAGDEAQALAQARRTAVDLAIVDLSLMRGSGLGLFARLLRLQPALRLLVLSMHDEAIYAHKVLRAGAHGYVMKQAATDALLDALHTLLAGHCYVSPVLRDRMLGAGVHVREAGAASAADHLACLTRTELLVLQMIGNGASSRAVATQLNRSIKTIDVHRNNIRRKLGLDSAHALIGYAIRSALAHA